jgi:hypothetical protein
VSKVKSKLDGIVSLVRSTGQHPRYVMRHRAELGDPFTFEIYADARNARNARGQRIWVRREESLNSAVAWMMQNADRLVSFAARSRRAQDEELDQESERADPNESPDEMHDPGILLGNPVAAK